MKKLLFTVIAIIFSFSLVAQTALLKLNLEKNKVYRLKSVSEQTVSQTINGNQQTTDSKVHYTISLKMIDATADFIVAEVHFDTLITNSNAMGKAVSISSAVEGDIKSSETADVMSYIMNRLSKNTAYVKIDYAGKPVEIINAKMISDMVLKDTNSITLSGPVGSAVKMQITNTVSESSLKTIISSFTWCLPAKQVTAGESWNLTQQLNSGGMALDIISDYHLDRISGSNAIITAESNIKPSTNAPPIKSAGATVTYDNLQGLSKSNFTIDIQTGLTTLQTSKTHISGTLGISGPGFSMQMPMDINGEAKVTLLK